MPALLPTDDLARARTAWLHGDRTAWARYVARTAALAAAPRPAPAPPAARWTRRASVLDRRRDGRVGEIR